MLVDFEVLLLLNVCIFLTVLAFLIREKNSAQLVFNLLSAISWFTLSLVYVASGSTFPVVAYLFLAIGIVLSVFTAISSAKMLGSKTWR